MLNWRRARRAATRCRKLWQVTLATIGEGPYVLAVTAAVLLALLAVGLASVLTASAVSVRNAKDLAEKGLGNQVALALKEGMLIATFGSELLATVVKRQPECRTLDAAWDDIAEDIMGKVNPEVVKQLEVDVAGVIWKTFPPLTGKTAEILYGRDLLKQPSDRPGMLYALNESRTLFLGPYDCQDGFRCSFVVTPVFLPAPSEEYDWGCGFQPYNCTDLCWDPAKKVKYWGQVSTMLNLDLLLSSKRLRVLAERGYRYKLWQAETSVSNPYRVLEATTEPPSDPVALTIANYNVLWYLELAPSGGWVPPWRDPCLAAVVVGSLLVSLLVLWLLVSKEQHNRLLRAMLPDEVIKQLQAGETPAAQEYDTVTVLFSDIVGYTCVASQLAPRQVVTLLNELFSVFDELTQRNGVYKVETIGDALMCVAGCPVPDDPIASAVRIANMALDMVTAVQQFRPSLAGVQGVKIRVGIHSGPVVAGVVGKKMPRYCLFGDTVNTSSRMESTSEPMRIQVSAATASLLGASGLAYELEPRGPVKVKGKGAMDTFWLNVGPQPAAARGQSFLAALRRPPSLIICPPPPPPPHPKRITPRAMTWPEAGKQTILGPPAAVAPLAGPAAAATTAATAATAAASPHPPGDFQVLSYSSSIDGPLVQQQQEQQQQQQLQQQQQQQQQQQLQKQRQDRQQARRQESQETGQQARQAPSPPPPPRPQQRQQQQQQQQWLQPLPPLQPLQPLSACVAGLSPDSTGCSGRKVPRRCSLSQGNLSQAPDSPLGSSLSAGGLPLHDAVGCSSIGFRGDGGGADNASKVPLPLTEYNDDDDDDDDDSAPLDICASALTMRTAMGMAAAAAAAAMGRGRSVSAIDLSSRLMPSAAAAATAAADSVVARTATPARGAAALPRTCCGLTAPAPPLGSASRFGAAAGGAAAAAAAAGAGGGNNGGIGGGRCPSRLRALAMRLPLRRSLAQRQLATRSVSASMDPLPLPLDVGPASGPAAAAAAAAAAPRGGGDSSSGPHHAPSLFRLASRERSSLGSDAFMALGGSAAVTSSEPATGGGGGGGAGGQPLFTLTLESDKALEHMQQQPRSDRASAPAPAAARRKGDDGESG